MAKLVSADLTNDAELCILYYETTNKELLQLGRWPHAFDAKVISHTYDKVGTVIFEKPITCIGGRVFSDYANLKSIWVPNSVASIGKDVFANCKALENVYISNLSSWCRIDFANAYSNPLYYANHLYLNGELVIELTIPSDITQVNNYTFYGCRCLTSITIPNSIIEIQKSAFGGCCGQLNTFHGKFASADHRCLIINNKLIKCAPYNLVEYTIPNSVTSIGEDAFSNCTSLTSITIPDSVTSIGDSAFSGCASLKSIIIPDRVTSIGNWAFSGCASLKSIIIPDRVTSIGNWAFYQCSGELVINSKIVETDYDLLEDGGCGERNFVTGRYYWLSGSSFSHITIGENIQKVGNNVFVGCGKLTSIAIPNSVTKIGVDVFYDSCKVINIYISDLSAWCNIDFGYNKRHIVFYSKKLYLNGKLLTEVNIPSNVTEIKDMSFTACNDITSITIPDSITKIGHYAFHYCRSLTSVYYNGDLSTWCKINFSGPLFNRLFKNSKTKLYINNKELTDIVIPANITKIKPYTFHDFNSLTQVIMCNGVTSIGEYAFYNCTSLKSITIPDSVTSIGNDAFYKCTSLTSVTIPDSVTSIGELAFSDCTSLTSVTIPDSVTSIGSYAFYGCTSLTNITIPDSVTSIGDFAFNKCTGLIEVIIGNKAVDIGKDIFKDCNSLASVTIHDNTEEIWRDIFRGIMHCVTDIYVKISNLAKYCENNRSEGIGRHTHLLVNNKEVTELVIPNDVTRIGNCAFYGCTSLRSVIIPDSVTEIGSSAFYNCTSLTSIIIPDSVTSISESTFHCCCNLASVIIGEGVSLIGESAFNKCSSLNNVVIGNGVTSIGKWAFCCCDSLTRIIIPDNVTSIEELAFRSCKSLSHITIGRSVAKIGDSAFWGTHIDTIVCRATTPPKLYVTYNSDWREYSLSSFEKFETLIVPTGCEEAYSNSDWGKYIREETDWYDEAALLQDERDYERQQMIEDGDYYVNDIDDAEYESYLALGGDPEKYRKGCLDNFMDSIGL